MKKRLVIVTGLSVAVLTSCGSGKTEETKSVGDTVVTKTEKVDTTALKVDEYTRFKFDFAVANIPSPAELINDMASYNFSYNTTFLNDVSKVNSYNTDFSKAINLGIYNLDMAYAMANGKGTDVLKYLKTSLNEMDALGMKAAFDRFISKRTETNLNNRDSLLRIVDELYIKADNYLRTNERVETATHIFVGSWVEALSIICRTGGEEKDAIQKARVQKQLWDQRFYLKNMIDLVAAFKAKKEDADLMNDLTDIHTAIDVIKEPKELNEKKFKVIATKIIALRDKLTK
jgi:Cdc6-like AAA superfamily ATPase